MGTYWEGTGRLQVQYEALMANLVPGEGDSETLEGEMLSAAGRLHYEFHNNGGGNNVSGALLFLNKYLPTFDASWYEGLAPYVTGTVRPVEDEYEDVLATCDHVLDSAVSHVAGRDGIYVAATGSFRSMNVNQTGMEPPEPDDEMDNEVDDSPAYS